MPLNEAVNIFLLVYASLFPIVNPVGGAPIFYSMTRHCSDKERHTLARKVAVNGFLLAARLAVRRLACARVLRHHAAGGQHRGRARRQRLRLAALTCQRRAYRAAHDTARRARPCSVRWIPSIRSRCRSRWGRARYRSRSRSAAKGRRTSIAYPQLRARSALRPRLDSPPSRSRSMSATGSPSGSGRRSATAAPTCSCVSQPSFLLCIGIQIVWNGYKGLGGLAVEPAHCLMRAPLGS